LCRVLASAEECVDPRQAIVACLRDSVDEIRGFARRMTTADVTHLVLMTRYLDTLDEVGASSRSNAIRIPRSPGSLAGSSDQIRNAMIGANETVAGGRVTPEAMVAAGSNGG